PVLIAATVNARSTRRSRPRSNAPARTRRSPTRCQSSGSTGNTAAETAHGTHAGRSARPCNKIHGRATDAAHPASSNKDTRLVTTNFAKDTNQPIHRIVRQHRRVAEAVPRSTRNRGEGARERLSSRPVHVERAWGDPSRVFQPHDRSTASPSPSTHSTVTRRYARVASTWWT